jgi:hypothetical protein
VEFDKDRIWKESTLKDEIWEDKILGEKLNILRDTRMD